MKTFFNIFAFLFILSNLAYFIFLRPSEIGMRFKSRSEPFIENKSGADPVLDPSADVTEKPDNAEMKKAVSDSRDTVQNQPDTNRKFSVLGQVIKTNLTPASLTAAGYKGFTFSNPELRDKISSGLRKHRVRPQVAEKTAERLAKIAGGKLFRRTSIGVMGAGITYMVAQFSWKNMTFLEKVSLGVCGGILLILIYNGFVRTGVME